MNNTELPPLRRRGAWGEVKKIMKMKKIIISIVTLAAICSLQVAAQAIHEFSVDVGGGLSTLSYKPSRGNRSGSFGGDFGVGYTYYRARERVTGTERIFRELWGIHTGLGIGMYNAQTNLDNQKLPEIKGLNDGDAVYSNFNLRTTLNSYTETQKTVYLNIPVMALFQIEQIYAMGGFKFGIPISGKYSSKNATITNEGYYPDLENSATTQEFAGYGPFRGKNFEGDLQPGVAVMLALEAGYKWRIADNLSVYTGLYFDCGLNNTIKDSAKSFVNYTNKHPKDFTTNSVLTTFANKTKPMAVGIKLRFAMEK